MILLAVWYKASYIIMLTASVRCGFLSIPACIWKDNRLTIVLFFPQSRSFRFQSWLPVTLIGSMEVAEAAKNQVTWHLFSCPLTSTWSTFAIPGWEVTCLLMWMCTNYVSTGVSSVLESMSVDTEINYIWITVWRVWTPEIKYIWNTVRTKHLIIITN